MKTNTTTSEKKYEASLTNKSAIAFDDGDFETVEDVIEWAVGRGDSYVLHVTTDKNMMGVNVSIRDADVPVFSVYDGWEWQHYAEAELVAFLKANL